MLDGGAKDFVTDPRARCACLVKLPDPAELEDLRARFPEVSSRPDEELASMWAAVVLRLRDRGLIRGHGSVPGELAESLMCRWYAGKLSDQSTPDVDLETPRGRKLQVKALRYTDPGRSSVAAFPRPVAFDELAIVRFEYDMRVRDALLLESRLLRVPDETGEGVLTRSGRRLSLGRRVERVAHVVTASELLRPGAGAAWDDRARQIRTSSALS
jgi:hypothetical protein